MRWKEGRFKPKFENWEHIEKSEEMWTWLSIHTIHRLGILISYYMGIENTIRHI